MKRDYILITALVFLTLLIVSSCRLDSQHDLKVREGIYDNDSIIAQEEDNFYYRIKNGNLDPDLGFESFSGVDAYWKIEAVQDSLLNLKYDLILQKGEFKVVLVTPAGEVISIVDRTASGESEVVLPEGLSRIKVVGRNAQGEISLEVEACEGAILERLKH